MKAYGFQIGAWEGLTNGSTRDDRSFTFGLSVVQLLGNECGLSLQPLADNEKAHDCDAIFISILSTDNYWDLHKWFRKRKVILNSTEREEDYPLIVGGGQAFYNPEPVADAFDIIFIGEVDNNLKLFIDIFNKYRKNLSRINFLDKCREIPGVYIPRLDTDRVIYAQFADNIDISLRQQMLDYKCTVRRIEGARGCRKKCPFCVLGWRVPYRENLFSDIKDNIDKYSWFGKRIHIQAGDIEGHSEIKLINDWLNNQLLQQSSTASRLDNIVKNKTIPNPQQYFTFGLEAPSYRMRKVYGKPYTNDFFIECLNYLYDKKLRSVGFHIIFDLPGETDEDLLEWDELTLKIAEPRAINDRHFVLKWHQAFFQPASFTPLQWARPGMSCRMRDIMLKNWHIDDDARFLQSRQRRVRSLTTQLMCVITTRGDRRIFDFMPKLQKRLYKCLKTNPETPELVKKFMAEYGLDTNYYYNELDYNTNLPWDFLRAWKSKDKLWSLWQNIKKRLSIP